VAKRQKRKSRAPVPSAVVQATVPRRKPKAPAPPAVVQAVAPALAMGWVPDLPDHRDHPYGAMRLALEQPVQPLPSVDLRADFPAPYDQGSLNSCTANALAGAIAFDIKKQALPALTPSRLFIYYNQRALQGTISYDSGGSVRRGIKAIASQFACSEDNQPDGWPYGKPFTAEPSVPCYQSAEKYLDNIEIAYYSLDHTKIDELKACLGGGNVFVFGFTLYKSFHDADTNGGIVRVPTSSESVLGGHAVVAVGYNDAKGWFIVRSSWGITVGDHGYYYMPYQYVTSPNLSDDFWTLRATKVA
jgi:C1A family cysteine protease